jgi:hypothetical protein
VGSRVSLVEVARPTTELLAERERGRESRRHSVRGAAFGRGGNRELGGKAGDRKTTNSSTIAMATGCTI